MISDEIVKELFALKDLKYKTFQSKLIPSVDEVYFIGVRTPELRRLAKEYGKREEISEFLDVLPHSYFDENQLHAFIISGIKEFESCIAEVCRFLPYVDNWATCDQMSPKCFKKHREELLNYIYEWIKSDEAYTVRFGIGMLMQHFLDEAFKNEYAKAVADVTTEEYYVNMMRAWYFATALAKQYEAVIPYFEEKILDEWTHKKAIQKAIESYRITPEQKDYLRTLK